MSGLTLPVVVHGMTGRMGQIAVRALQSISSRRALQFEGEPVTPEPIGVGRNPSKVDAVAAELGLSHAFVDLNRALDLARKINPDLQLYHNTLTTGIRRASLLQVLPLLDPSKTAVYMEKPLASNYADGYAIVRALEDGGFRHGVVHHMLATPGVRRALELMPRIKPVSAHMVFGYEVGPGFSGNEDYAGQRPDFNWRYADAGGGIILDMCHEGYLSEALFGPSERLSAVARLLVPERRSTDGRSTIVCDVEDYAALRREHRSGVVNTSIWSWYRRVNSEFGPLEISVEGLGGSLVFGLYGLKVQWAESAPANRWERSVTGKKTVWRDFWTCEDPGYQDPFAHELVEYLSALLEGRSYPKNAVHALDLLGEVEAFYSSAARDGIVIERSGVLSYPAAPPDGWEPERLQSRLRSVSG